MFAFLAPLLGSFSKYLPYILLTAAIVGGLWLVHHAGALSEKAKLEPEIVRWKAAAQQCQAAVEQQNHQIDQLKAKFAALNAHQEKRVAEAQADVQAAQRAAQRASQRDLETKAPGNGDCEAWLGWMAEKGAENVAGW